MKSCRRTIRPPAMTELLTVTVFGVLFFAILFQPAKWAASGTITLPVEVAVVDSTSAAPIQGADVAILWASQDMAGSGTYQYQGHMPRGLSSLAKIVVKTNGAGIASFESLFRTGSNHEHPNSKIEARQYWVLVSAENYAPVTVPLDGRPRLAETLTSRGCLSVYVELVLDRNGI